MQISFSFREAWSSDQHSTKSEQQGYPSCQT